MGCAEGRAGYQHLGFRGIYWLKLYSCFRILSGRHLGTEVRGFTGFRREADRRRGRADHTLDFRLCTDATGGDRRVRPERRSKTGSHSRLPMCRQRRIPSVAFQCGWQHGRTTPRQSRIPMPGAGQVMPSGVASRFFSHRRSERFSRRNLQPRERSPRNLEQEPRSKKQHQEGHLEHAGLLCSR
jgi:hypothetical protein